MNPFVGLSKVTKKRLDALENFTKEVESIKEHVNDLEAILEKNANNPQFQSWNQPPAPRSNESKESSEQNITQEKTAESPSESLPIEDEKNDESQDDNNTDDKPINEGENKIKKEDENIKPSTPSQKEILPLPTSLPINNTDYQAEPEAIFNETFIEEIITSSLDYYLIDQNIEYLIDEYLHTLK